MTIPGHPVYLLGILLLLSLVVEILEDRISNYDVVARLRPGPAEGPVDTQRLEVVLQVGNSVRIGRVEAAHDRCHLLAPDIPAVPAYVTLDTDWPSLNTVDRPITRLEFGFGRQAREECFLQLFQALALLDADGKRRQTEPGELIDRLFDLFRSSQIYLVHDND